MSVLFDTLKLADRLEAGGFTATQAKTASSAFSEAFAVDLATKTDLANAIELVRTDLSREISAVRTELKNESALIRVEVQQIRQELKADNAKAVSDMTRLMLGSIGLQTIVTIGTVITLLKLFVK